MLDYKDIHIGSHLKVVAEFRGLSMSRACSFLNCSSNDIKEMYTQTSLDSQLLLRWCKLLDYNFFMFYHTHLQLYKPVASTSKLISKSGISKPLEEEYSFRKNLYSPEIIDWLMDQFDKKKLSAKDIIERYQIPKTTFYRWKKRDFKNV